MTELKWTRPAPDVFQVEGLPIRLRKFKVPGGSTWMVQVPLEPDSSYDYADGWAWMDAWDENTTDGYPLRLDAGGRIELAKAYAEENLDQILAYAAKQRSGWPHLDGVPADVGKYIASYQPDGSIVYASPEPPSDTQGIEISSERADLQKIPFGRLNLSGVAQAVQGLVGPFATPPSFIEPDEPEPPTIADELRDVITELSETIAATREHIVDNPTWPNDLGTRPEAALDRNGRPMLADMLAAKANALAALANLEAAGH